MPEITEKEAEVPDNGWQRAIVSAHDVESFFERSLVVFVSQAVGKIVDDDCSGID